jgi:hypothetical protein
VAFFFSRVVVARRCVLTTCVLIEAQHASCVELFLTVLFFFRAPTFWVSEVILLNSGSAPAHTRWPVPHTARCSLMKARLDRVLAFAAAFSVRELVPVLVLAAGSERMNPRRALTHNTSGSVPHPPTRLLYFAALLFLNRRL